LPQLSSDVFARLPEVAGRMRCPDCGSEHIWWASEAWLGEPTLVPKPGGV